MDPTSADKAYSRPAGSGWTKASLFLLAVGGIGQVASLGMLLWSDSFLMMAPSLACWGIWLLGGVFFVRGYRHIALLRELERSLPAVTYSVPTEVWKQVISEVNTQFRRQYIAVPGWVVLAVLSVALWLSLKGMHAGWLVAGSLLLTGGTIVISVYFGWVWPLENTEARVMWYSEDIVLGSFHIRACELEGYTWLEDCSGWRLARLTLNEKRTLPFKNLILPIPEEEIRTKLDEFVTK